MKKNLQVNDSLVPRSGLGRVLSVADREIVVEFQSTLTGKMITKKFNAEMAEQMGMTFQDFMDKFFVTVEGVQ